MLTTTQPATTRLTVNQARSVNNDLNPLSGGAVAGQPVFVGQPAWCRLSWT